MNKNIQIVSVLMVISFLLFPDFSFSQTRMVLNNNAYLVIDNSAFLVLENSNSNALSVAGTGGNIKSESENNRVRWLVGNSTGTYSIPFSDDVVEGGDKIPFTINIATAGVGSGFYDFSTYDGASWDNQTYMPSMVTHMGQHNPPNVVNHSAHAIDRFWLISPQSYTTKPEPSSMVFTYIDAEYLATGNLLPEASMGAQRFNTSVNKWGDMLPIGAANVSLNTVTTPAVSPSNFFAAWTLSNILNPLPVTLTKFSATCNSQGNQVKWTTASEQNSDYFLIEKTTDFENWNLVGKVSAQGNSNTIKNYELVDVARRSELTYYRLTQVDFNGSSEAFKAISVACDSYSYEVSVFPNPNAGNFTLQIESDQALTAMNVSIQDVSGRLIYKKEVQVETGLNDFYIQDWDISSGSYLLKLSHPDKETKMIRFVVK